MEKVAIVTITYNSESVLVPFFDSLLKQTYTNIKLYVIDNASTDNTLNIIDGYNSNNILLIKNTRNEGVAKANNQGIKQALNDGCNHIVIANNDIEFESDLILRLLNKKSKHNASIISPKIMYYDRPNLIWYAGAWFIKNKGYLPLHKGINEVDNGQYDHVLTVEYAPTCFLLIDKKVFSDIGYMDEKYFVYFDDTDFLYRIWKNGRHKTIIDTSVKIYHKVGSLTKSFNSKGKKIYRGNFFLRQNIRNHVYFLRKTGTMFSYLYIIWLLILNNIKFFIKPNIQKNLKTWILINTSYFKGLLLK